MYRVYSRAGWGSSMAEALLELSGLPYEIVEIDPRGNPEDRRKLAALNPLAQLPTIETPDGNALTESGAIALYIAEQAPEAGLAPTIGDPLRAPWLRWQVFLVANIYASFMIEDMPERWADNEAARAEIGARGLSYRQELYRVFEDNTGTPWFLGTPFSTIDVFVSIMTRWAPRRDWFEVNCPKLHSIAVAVDEMPALAKVWKRNFGPDKQYQ
jgi:GST-like protein